VVTPATQPGTGAEDFESKRRALEPAVEALLQAPHTVSLGEVLASHPELADPLARMVAFAYGAEAFVGHENKTVAEMFSRRMRLLNVLSHDGKDAALASFQADVMRTQLPELRRAWEAAESRPDGDASGAWSALLVHPAFGEADPDFQRLTLDRAIAARRLELAARPAGGQADPWASLARLYRRSYVLDSRPADLDHAISAYQAAAAALPPDHAELPVLLGELASGLHTRFGLTSDPADLEAAIEIHGRAATHNKAQPALRAKAANDRGLLLIDRSERGEPGAGQANLDAAVESFHLAVQESADIGQQDLLSDSLSNLTYGYWTRYQRSARPEDLEAAARHAAATVERTSAGSPAFTRRLANLSLVHWEVFRRTGRREAIDSVIDAQQQLAEARPPDTAFQVEMLADLGRALRRRYELASDPADLDAALNAFRGALGHTAPGSPAHPGYLLDLGTVLAAKYEASASTDVLDEAIASFRRVAADGTGSPLQARALGNLGGLLISQFEETGNPACLDEAVTTLTEASRASAGTPAEAAILESLAVAYQRRYFSTGRRADLEQITELQGRALGLTGQDAPPLAGQLAGVGRAMRTLGGRADAGQDIDAVISYYQRASEQASDLLDQSVALGYLGDALLDRYQGSASLADLDTAVDSFRRATETAAASVPLLGRQLNRLAGALTVRSRQGRVSGDLAAAAAAYRRALALPTQAAGARADTLMSFGVAVLGRRDIAERPGQADEAVSALRAGCALGATTNPQMVIQAASMWGDWALGRQSWPEAAEAYRAALAAAARLVESDPGREHRQSWLRHARDLADSAAYAFARSGDLHDAVQTLEGWRATLLSAALAPGLSATPPDASTVSLDDSDAAVVYLAATLAGGVALLVRPGPQLDAVWLPELIRSELSRRAWDYLSHRGRAGWAGEVDDLTHWLWSAALGPLLSATEARHLILVPGGVLGLLPLHAAWTHDQTTETGRRYALDQVLVTYTGNMQVLDACRQTAEALTVNALCAVGDASGLPHARQELDAAANCFPQVTRPGAASAEAVLAALGGSQVLHFACHGLANPADPLGSALLIAPGERLTMEQVLGKGVPGTRLVVLSACETAVPGTDLLDEAAGMPSTFIEAGAAAAVGSLWEVPDEATMMLMACFYEFWRIDGLPPAQALRRAQQWLRDSTNIVKLQRFPATAERSNALSDWAQSDWEEGRKHASPWHWASFVYVGA
jgi:CHAT domain